MSTTIEEKDEPIDSGDGTEKEFEDAKTKLMDKPFDPDLINIETKTPSLSILINRIERRTIEMDTTTYFQRQDDLWNKTKQSRLIESIFIQFPLPAFFFDSSDNNSWLIVDGLQRLSSIRNFRFRNQPLSNLEFLTDMNGKCWEDLPAYLQTIMEECQIVIHKIMPGTPGNVKFNIFKRINTGGLLLEPQEIRHALFQGRPAKFVAELGQTEAFKKATNYKIKTQRMLDRDFANRFLAFYFFGAENFGTRTYGQDLDTFMSKAMEIIRSKTEIELLNVKKAFENAMTLASDIFEKEAFRKIYKYSHKRLPPINKALFDALSTQFAHLTENEIMKLRAKAKEFRQELKMKLAEDNQLFAAVSSATGDRNKTIYRHHAIKKMIMNLIK